MKLGSFEIDIYKFETLKLWDFDLKFGTWNLKFWNLEFWKLRLEILIMKSKVWIFFGNWKFEFKNLGTENVELKIWEWKFWIDNLGVGVVLEDLFGRFILWRFVQEIFPLKIYSWYFSFHEDVLMKIWSGDFSFEDLFRRFLLLKMCSWRFVHLRFVHGDLSFEDLFMDIFPFMKMCSWKFIQEIFPFMNMCSWRFVQEIFPLKFF